MTEPPQLLNRIGKLEQAAVLVLGDVMLDRFVYGDVSRISPEGPVPVLRSGEVKFTLGGAGNVARNLLALGSKPYLISLVGDDPEGQQISDILSDLKNVESELIVEPQRKTTVKSRFMAGQQQLLRVDTEVAYPLDKNSFQTSLQALSRFINLCDVVILSDYHKGFLGPHLLRAVIDICREQRKHVLVDPKGTDYSIYRNASVLTPNLKELAEATHLPVNGDRAVVTAAQKLINSCNLDAVLVTRSQEGMSLIEESGEVTHLKSDAKEVFDVTGAGDTVVAVLAAALASGARLPEAAELANIAAGIVVGKVGTAVAYPAELVQTVQDQELSGGNAKVLDIQAAIDKVEQWKCKGYKIGFTNGFFELLHPAHLRLLCRASKSCDRLIVGLNSDSSIYRLKGELPILLEAERSTILASLEVVDAVVTFQEDTPVRLIEVLRPDVLIKGANYGPEAVVGADIVRSYGGNVLLVDIEDIATPDFAVVQMSKANLLAQ